MKVYPQFTNGEANAQGGYVTYTGSGDNRWQTGDVNLDPISWAPTLGPQPLESPPTRHCLSMSECIFPGGVI